MAKAISVTIVGLEPLMKKLSGLSKLTRDDVVSTALLAGAYVLEGYAKVNAPVDTGFERGTIYSSTSKESNYAERAAEAKAANPDGHLLPESRPKPGEAKVGVAAEYGAALEYKPPDKGGRPHLRPALDEHKDEIIEAVRANLADMVKRIVR